MVDSRLGELERELLRVTGVTGARVIGDDEPREIHVVSTPARPPKQVVRDVQSLAAARYGLTIDHRIISVVQIEEEPETTAPEPPAPPPPPEPPAALSEADVEEDASHNGHRPVVDRVVVANKGDAGWVKVALRWPAGVTTEGAGAAGSSREARARGAVAAVIQALMPVLEPAHILVDIDHVLIHRLGSSDAVLVKASLYDRRSSTPVVGTALVYDDVATAAVRAALHAVNRKLPVA